MDHLLLALPAVFAIVDPLGCVPLFIAMTARDTPDKARKMALKACLTGAGILIVFALFGGLIFKLFDVTLGAFRVAGGVLLTMTALDMVRGKQSSTRTSDQEEKEGVEKDDIAIVPLAIPLLAGPGSMATVMVLMAEGDGLRTGTAVVLSILLTFAAAYAILSAAPYIKRVLKQTGITIMQRVFGLILGAIAVEFIANGVRALMKA